ncbi:hypothetical protein HJC23_012810 [Cyclotella cryptica]|uniref:CDAN1-interacting nuclease 1 n=1 Tax=Cyclotella cryptica TaxID=29204 RepID=A0ABD3P439_9STRA|eukprot:CCRYP_018621-RA/>CCRYP_018621-RA protein AED:0.09 eAED:0.09 QI:222/0.8/0.66/1/0.4/0.5/6/492/365
MITSPVKKSSRHVESDDAQCDAYDQAELWCRERISSGHDMLFSRQIFHNEIKTASNNFGLPFEAIHSLFRNAHVSYMKRTSHMLKSQTTRHVQSYLNGASIINIAKKVNYPPSMMARLIVENVANNSSSNELENTMGVNVSNRKFITEAIRHPEKSWEMQALLKGRSVHNEKGDNDLQYILLSRLSLEVREAVDSDPMYGPHHDRMRHNIGIDYELLLEQMLHSMQIPFETEEELRARGTARTPDILLSCPLGLQVRKTNYHQIAELHESDIDVENSDEYEWKMICWIDSKALYGDVGTHTSSVLPQVESYVHRFGPGLVIYWFGHAPLSRLGDSHGDVLIRDGLPDVFMLPTGEFRRKNGQNNT